MVLVLDMSSWRCLCLSVCLASFYIYDRQATDWHKCDR